MSVGAALLATTVRPSRVTRLPLHGMARGVMVTATVARWSFPLLQASGTGLPAARQLQPDLVKTPFVCASSQARPCWRNWLGTVCTAVP